MFKNYNNNDRDILNRKTKLIPIFFVDRQAQKTATACVLSNFFRDHTHHKFIVSSVYMCDLRHTKSKNSNLKYLQFLQQKKKKQVDRDHTM